MNKRTIAIVLILLIVLVVAVFYPKTYYFLSAGYKKDCYCYGITKEIDAIPRSKLCYGIVSDCVCEETISYTDGVQSTNLDIVKAKCSNWCCHAEDLIGRCNTYLDIVDYSCIPSICSRNIFDTTSECCEYEMIHNVTTKWEKISCSTLVK